jgi:hypothetical protein
MNTLYYGRSKNLAEEELITDRIRLIQMGILDCLTFVSDSLSDKAPRVQWESAKVIANIAHRYPKKLDNAICNLLANSESSGTVVRWCAALALGEIVKLRTKHTKGLIPAIYPANLFRGATNDTAYLFQTTICS